MADSHPRHWAKAFVQSSSLIIASAAILTLAYTRSHSGLLFTELPSRTKLIIYVLLAVALILFILSQFLSLFSPHSLPGSPTSPKKFLRNLLTTLISSLILMAGVNQTIIISNQLQRNLGHDIIAVSGTGSMYPTFPKGTLPTQQERESEVVTQVAMEKYPHGLSLGPYKFFAHDLQVGDIVSFASQKTFELNHDSGATGFIKRLIALPGDTLELRDGIVYRNQIPQKEPYVARAHSTFGGPSIHECQVYQVPSGQAIVLGDNRKGSLDSRSELGFINLSDIDHVLPLTDQTLYQSLWHNPENDLSSQSKINLDTTDYLQKLNLLRASHQAHPLKFNSALTKSAQLRGQKILQFNDFSPEATQSSYPIEKSMLDAGYRNILWGETIIQGYYESDELIENQQSLPKTLEFLTNPNFDDIGIAQVQGEINHCPTQVIVVQFGGYQPPQYDSAMIASWNQALASLQAIQPSWQNLTTYPEFYQQHQTDIDRLNQIIALRITRITAITEKFNHNQWLSDEENSWIKQDATLNTEQQQLAQHLNHLN